MFLVLQATTKNGDMSPLKNFICEEFSKIPNKNLGLQDYSIKNKNNPYEKFEINPFSEDLDEAVMFNS